MPSHAWLCCRGKAQVKRRDDSHGGGGGGGGAGVGGGLPPLIQILAYFATQVGVMEKLVDHMGKVGKIG